MSHTRVKTTYSEMGSYGSTDKVELFCHHSHGSDCTTFYNVRGEVMSMAFCSWESGNDLWDAMLRLNSPFKDEWGGELKDGVEYYYGAPWEEKKTFNGSVFTSVGQGITTGCIAPEAKDLLDKIMAEWEKTEQETSIYGFAYWLVRWSGLVQPTNNK